MITDVSAVSPTYLLIGFFVILLLGVVVGLFRGFIKTILGIVLYVVYAIIIFFLANPVATWLSSYGFIEKWMDDSGFTSSEVYAILSGFMSDVTFVAYKVITIVALLIIGFIVVRVVSFLLNKIVSKFKLMKKLNRALGAVFGGLISSVVLGALLTILSCELLFAGGSTWINNTPVVREFNNVTTELRVNLLCKNGIPCDVESLLARAIGGKDLDAKRARQYADTLRRVDDIIADPDAYLNQAVNEDGSLNREGVSNILNDASVLSELAARGDVGGHLTDAAQELIGPALEELPDDVALELTDEDVENLGIIADNLDLTDAQREKVNQIISNRIPVE